MLFPVLQASCQCTQGHFRRQNLSWPQQQCSDLCNNFLYLSLTSTDVCTAYMFQSSYRTNVCSVPIWTMVHYLKIEKLLFWHKLTYVDNCLIVLDLSFFSALELIILGDGELRMLRSPKFICQMSASCKLFHSHRCDKTNRRGREVSIKCNL